jgi:hypothetical protein
VPYLCPDLLWAKGENMQIQLRHRRPCGRTSPLRTRVKLRFTPEWSPIIKNWAAKFVRDNQWRADSIHGFDDLMQDAYLLFVKVSERYPRVMDPKHFMALYKTTLRNNMHDHARYMQRKRVLHEDTSEDVSDLYADRVGELTNGGYISSLLSKAPLDLKRALDLLTQNPPCLNDAPSKRRRENLNMKIRRVLNSDIKFDTALKSLLTQ